MNILILFLEDTLNNDHRYHWLDWFSSCSHRLCAEYVQKTGRKFPAILLYEYSRKHLFDSQYDLPSCHSFGCGKYHLDNHRHCRIGKEEIMPGAL